MKKETLIKIVGYVGMGCMIIAPPIIDTVIGKSLAITGLSLLTIQTIELKAINLTALNVAGISGYLYALFSWQLLAGMVAYEHDEK